MRRQPPVYSPMSAGALLAGAAGALRAAPSANTELLIRSKWPAAEVLLTDSGTSALSLALRAAATKKSLVALPAFGCYDLATAADGADVRVVLYDVDAETLTPEPESLARALARKPDAVVVVHLYGIAPDFAAIQRAAFGVGALVIEDAAQAFGTMVNGVPAGALGTLGVLSFGRGKGLSAGGGGALVTQEAQGVALLRNVSALLQKDRAGWTEWLRATAQWALARPALYDVPASLPGLRLGETIYHESRPPRALSRAARRILEKTWHTSQHEVAVRRANAQRLRQAAAGSRSFRAVNVNHGAEPGYLRLPILADPERRAAHLARAANRLGIMPSYPNPLSHLPGFRRRCINANERFPGAQLLCDSLITLPTHSLLTETDLRRLEDWLNE